MAENSTYKMLKQRVSELERQNEMLQSEVIKYRTLFDSFPHGIIVSDSYGNVVEANSISEQLLGISKEEHKKEASAGKKLRIIRKDGTDMPPDEWASVVALKEKRMVTGSEMGVIKSDGQTTWINATAAPLQIEGYGVVTIYNDITMNIQEEAMLRKSEKKYRFLTEHMVDIVWTLDLEFRTTYVSQSIENILGFTTEERKTQLIEEMITPQSLKVVQEKYLEEIARDQEDGIDLNRSVIMEVEYYRKDGSTVWMENSVQFVRDSKNEIVGLLGVSRDITERRKLEKILKDSEAQKRAILDSSLDSIRLVDKDMRIIWSNKLIETQLQKERKEIIGDYCYHAYTGRSEPCPNCPTKKALESGKTEHSVIIEENVKGIEGKSYWADYAVPITNESGEIVNFIQVSRDITDLKKAELALLEETNKLALALSKVKKLSGMLPICSICKKIRDDKGYWNQIEAYIADHSDAEFSHSMCQECGKKYYPDMDLYDDGED